MSDDPGRKQRTYTYHPDGPLADAVRSGEQDGLTVLRAWRDGTLPPPPIVDTIAFELTRVEPGEVEFTLQPAEHHYSPLSSVHGGIYATVLDSGCGCAVHSRLPAGTGYVSVDLNVKFLRRITLDTGPVRCVGKVVHLGRRTALARAELLDGKGSLLAEATSTCLLLAGD